MKPFCFSHARGPWNRNLANYIERAGEALSNSPRKWISRMTSSLTAKEVCQNYWSVSWLVESNSPSSHTAAHLGNSLMAHQLPLREDLKCKHIFYFWTLFLLLIFNEAVCIKYALMHPDTQIPPCLKKLKSLFKENSRCPLAVAKPSWLAFNELSDHLEKTSYPSRGEKKVN